MLAYTKGTPCYLLHTQKGSLLLVDAKESFTSQSTRRNYLIARPSIKKRVTYESTQRDDCLVLLHNGVIHSAYANGLVVS